MFVDVLWNLCKLALWGHQPVSQAFKPKLKESSQPSRNIVVNARPLKLSHTMDQHVPSAYRALLKFGLHVQEASLRLFGVRLDIICRQAYISITSYIHICKYVYIYAYIISVHICIYIYILVLYTHIHMHVCMCIYANICVYVQECTRVHLYVQIYVPIHVCCLHIHIHSSIYVSNDRPPIGQVCSVQIGIIAVFCRVLLSAPGNLAWPLARHPARRR